MAYEEDLANRIRELVAGDSDVTEKKMFGGLVFLVGGNMLVGASGQGGLMVRVDPEDSDTVVTKPHTRPFEMRGRALQGWLRVDAEGLRTKRELDLWVRRGVAYAARFLARTEAITRRHAVGRNGRPDQVAGRSGGMIRTCRGSRSRNAGLDWRVVTDWPRAIGRAVSSRPPRA